MTLRRRILTGLIPLVAAAILAPAAMATTPTLTLDQSAGTQAGADHNLGLTLGFGNNTAANSPEHLTINLPAGLLTNASIANGSCLTSVQTSGTACEVGTGVVDADILSLPLAPAQNVIFYLAPPPKAGDLAGLIVWDPGVLIHGQLGPTGDVTIRPSGSSLGVGATINLTLPNSAKVLGSLNIPIAVREIDSTFDNLRYPATCPSTAANLTASVDTYSDSTPTALSAPLSVTGCSSLAYNPAFAVSASKDSADKAVALTTTVTQTATEAPSRSVALAFPTSVLGPNTDSLGNLCLSATSGCTPVGSATASSPLYPTALAGKAYLTGTSSGLTLTLVFPAPFPLTLVGTVNLLTDTASFTGLPDIPLTNLGVTLDGGPRGLFNTDCLTPSGTATAGLVDQNGDQTRNVPANFTVSNCTAPTGIGTGGGGVTTGGGGGGTGGGSGSGGGSGTGGSAGAGHLVAKSVSGLGKGKPSFTFRVSVAKSAPKLTRLTVTLPHGLSVRHHQTHHRLRISGVRLQGAKVKSLRLTHGRLVITLRHATRAVTVKLGSASLAESHALRVKATTHKLKSLKLKVMLRNTQHADRTLTVTVRKLHL